MESTELDAWTVEKVQAFILCEFGGDVAQKFKGNRMACTEQLAGSVLHVLV